MEPATSFTVRLRTEGNEENKVGGGFLRIGEVTLCFLCLLLFKVSGSPLPLLIGEVHKHIPIIRRHGMFAFADIVAKAVANQAALRRHFIDAQTFDSEKAIDRIGGFEHVKLAGGIGPLIFLPVGEEHRARRAKSD